MMGASKAGGEVSSDYIKVAKSIHIIIKEEDQATIKVQSMQYRHGIYRP